MHRSITRRQAIGLMATVPALVSEPAGAQTHPVNETGFVRIGAIDQWIGIQGNDMISQLEFALEDLEAAATAAVAAMPSEPAARKSVRRPLPAHLVREPIVHAAPGECACPTVSDRRTHLPRRFAG